ncbi:MAG: hypothetical protein JWN44_1375 [Myxococcales bacterium]|nr:hypothetical protein [Myxococcales bacterium]
MRTMWPILLVLAGCGPDSGGGAAPPSSFVVDSCLPKPARVDGISLVRSDGSPVELHGNFPLRSGSQGLPMVDVYVHIEGEVDSCVAVAAHANYGGASGGLLVDAVNHTVHVFMGPVNNGFAFDVEIGGQQLHADVAYERVTALR